MTTYRPGSFFLTSISGPAGFAIGLGQALAGAPSRYEHAGIIVDISGTTVEAEPGGARFGHVADYAGHALLISDAPVQQAIDASDWAKSRSAELWPEDRAAMVSAARRAVVREAYGVVGLGYSPLDYLALALLHAHLPNGWVRRRVQRSGRMICSQLVDAVYERAGIHLFDDGRLPGDVMPADLAAWAEDHAQQVAA